MLLLSLKEQKNKLNECIDQCNYPYFNTLVYCFVAYCLKMFSAIHFIADICFSFSDGIQ